MTLRRLLICGLIGLTMQANIAAADESSPLSGTLLVSRLTDGTWQVWQTDLATSTRTQVTSSPGDKRKPGWTPDGRMAYHTSNHGYYVVAADRDPEPLLQAFWPIIDVAWARDGRSVVFSKLQAELVDQANLWSAHVSGDHQQVLTREAGLQYDAAWSPDGARIAYIGGQGFGNSELYVINADGSGRIQLTHNDVRELSPAWSPDGQRIAFVSDHSGDFEIWVIRADGSERIQLTSSPGLDANPAWSPDGTHLAFTTNRQGVLEIWVMGADGSDPQQLEQAEGGACEPAWR